VHCCPVECARVEWWTPCPRACDDLEPDRTPIPVRDSPPDDGDLVTIDWWRAGLEKPVIYSYVANPAPPGDPSPPLCLAERPAPAPRPWPVIGSFLDVLG